MIIFYSLLKLENFLVLVAARKAVICFILIFLLTFWKFVGYLDALYFPGLFECFE